MVLKKIKNTKELHTNIIKILTTDELKYWREDLPKTFESQTKDFIIKRLSIYHFLKNAQIKDNNTSFIRLLRIYTFMRYTIIIYKYFIIL